MEVLYYIKYSQNDTDAYWHKNKHKWVYERNKAIPYKDLEPIKKCLNDPNHGIYKTYVDKKDIKVIKVTVSEEEIVEGIIC